jgi:hypothetical protein
VRPREKRRQRGLEFSIRVDRHRSKTIAREKAVFSQRGWVAELMGSGTNEVGEEPQWAEEAGVPAAAQAETSGEGVVGGDDAGGEDAEVTETAVEAPGAGGFDLEVEGV